MSTSIRTKPWDYSCDDCDSCESRYACPVYNCSKHGNEAVKWVHGDPCGGSLRLYENGKEKCEKCGEEELFCLRRKCCYDESKNQKYSYLKIKNILAKLAGLDTRHCSTFFLIHVSMCIDYQFKRYPERFAD